jgi:hypothetical protein
VKFTENRNGVIADMENGHGNHRRRSNGTIKTIIILILMAKMSLRRE